MRTLYRLIEAKETAKKPCTSDRGRGHVLGMSLLVAFFFLGSAWAVPAADLVLIKRTCSGNTDGLSLALANIKNIVSATPDTIAKGISIELNKAKILKVVDMAKQEGANMVLFPEFSLTGYFWADPNWNKSKGPYNPRGYEECWAYMNKGALNCHMDWLKKLKAKLDGQLRYIIFNALRRDPANPSLPAGPDNKFFNSTYVVDKHFDCESLGKNEEARIYDKTFLPGIENIYERSGHDDILVVDTPWGRFGFTTCYDMCFSQLYQTYAMIDKVDGVIQLASWRGPAVRAYPKMNVRTDQYYGYQWNLMAAARAATNQVWMIACNAVGEQEKGGYEFWGSSGLWAPSGIPLFQASNQEEQVCLLNQIDIREEVEAEHDDFDFYDSFIKIYRRIPKMRAFTRMPE